MPMRVSTTELLVVLFIVLVIFGPTQLPKLSKMMGKSIKNLRAGMAEEEEEQEEAPKPKAKAKKEDDTETE